MAERLLDLGSGLAIYRVSMDEAREQSVNARTMPPGMFERLQQTIGRDQRLEQLPYLALVGDHLEVVSGHHRTRAARAGGLDHYHAIVDETQLTRSQIKAKQLAHNTISGSDEAQLVRRIFESIEDVDARLEAYVDPKQYQLPDVDRVQLPKMDLEIDYRSVLVTFLPHQAEQFERAVAQLVEQADLDRDELVLVDKALSVQWQATMRRLRKEYDARALSTVISKLLDATADVLGIEGRDPEDIDPEAWVPLSEVLGSALVPPDVADLLREAVDRMTKSGDVTRAARWRVLELLAADYNAGPGMGD